MQDKALVNRMCPAVCGYSQYSVAAAPIASHGASSHPATPSMVASITPHTACRREMTVFLSCFWLATDCIMDYCNSYQIPGLTHADTRSFIPTPIWAVCDEAKRAKLCFYVNNLSQPERLPCTEQ